MWTRLGNNPLAVCLQLAKLTSGICRTPEHDKFNGRNLQKIMWIKINAKLLICHFDKYGYMYSGLLSVLMNLALIVKIKYDHLPFFICLLLYGFIFFYGLEAGYKGYRNNKNYKVFFCFMQFRI